MKNVQDFFRLNEKSFGNSVHDAVGEATFHVEHAGVLAGGSERQVSVGTDVEYVAAWGGEAVCTSRILGIRIGTRIGTGHRVCSGLAEPCKHYSSLCIQYRRPMLEPLNAFGSGRRKQRYIGRITTGLLPNSLTSKIIGSRSCFGEVCHNMFLINRELTGRRSSRSILTFPEVSPLSPWGEASSTGLPGKMSTSSNDPCIGSCRRCGGTDIDELTSRPESDGGDNASSVWVQGLQFDLSVCESCRLNAGVPDGPPEDPYASQSMLECLHSSSSHR